MYNVAAKPVSLHFRSDTPAPHNDKLCKFCHHIFFNVASLFKTTTPSIITNVWGTPPPPTKCLTSFMDDPLMLRTTSLHRSLLYNRHNQQVATTNLYLITSLIHISSCVVVNSQHWNQTIRHSVCLRGNMITRISTSIHNSNNQLLNDAHTKCV